MKTMSSLLRLLILAVLAASLSGCVTPPTSLPRALVVPNSRMELPAVPDGIVLAQSTMLSETMPRLPRVVAGKPPLPPVTTAPLDDKADISLNFEQVPLTTFITVVYSELLKRPVNIDPALMSRRDLVTVRTPMQQTPAQIESTARLLLKSYGIAALDVGGLIRVIPDNASVGYLPEIRRGAALPETPQPLRPLFQLVELQAVRQTDVMGWLRTMFGDRVKLQEDSIRNAILLSGTSDNVNAAIEAIRVLDQPVMHGRASLKLTPAFWSAEELAKRISEILAAEGYSMPPANYSPLTGGVRYPVFLLPIAPTNSILVFANSGEVMAHIQEWAEKLDQPSKRASGSGYFTYTAQNTTAESLATTLNALLQSPGGSISAPASATGKPVAPTTSTALERSGRVVVDKTNNALIFQTTNEDFGQLSNLLRTLDRPSKSALIEVTVAEVSLTDQSDFGVEWLIKEAGIGGGIARTLSGGGGGLRLTHVDSSDTRLLLTALASSNRATILSTPRVMARNGETANIQVGREVPIITSQQSSLSTTTDPGTGAATTGILQTVQYRNTGVILRVKPTIHSGDMVDLDVQQEVSSAVKNETGVNSSPIILNKKLDTKLTLQNGSTVLLGGLISTDQTKGNAGIPFLKDIPGLGKLFGKDSDSQNRTELIVLITPYIVSNSKEAQAITEAFRSTLTSWSKDGAK